MRIMWIDTETTGIDPKNASVFNLGCLLVDNGKLICEREFWLNPLSDTILYNEETGKIHGFSKESIEALQPEKDGVRIYSSFFQEAKELFQLDGSKREKMYFAGYNCLFDFNHIKEQMARYGLKITDYFYDDPLFDVFVQAKNAVKRKMIPRLENLKLTTVAKSLGVEFENAHNALADIKATRSVATVLHTRGQPLV